MLSTTTSSSHKFKRTATKVTIAVGSKPSPMALILLNVLFIVSIPSCHAMMWEIPIPTSLQNCYNQVSRANISTYVGSTYSWFCETALKSSENSSFPEQFDAQKKRYYDQLYHKSIQVIQASSGKGRQVRAKRQAGQQRCLRREYRMLSDDERSRFHDAINALKSDTSVDPNKYDAIALLHTGMASFTAHGGVGFPGWHRIYTLMFESALREVDPSVCLPYWDSSLDSELDDPMTSIVWSPQFFGSFQGPVVDGPFAGWMTPEGSQLMRTVSSDGELMRREAIDDIMTRNSHAEILTSEDTDPRYDLEFHHAAVHVFCGGTMGQLDTSAFDPIFFIHHSFVDYLWETFRSKLRSQGIDPNIYPDVADVDSRHHGRSETGFGELTQADGYSDQLIDSYEYEAVPRCNSLFPDCGSRFLTCFDEIGRCVPVQRGFDTQQQQFQQQHPQQQRRREQQTQQQHGQHNHNTARQHEHQQQLPRFSPAAQRPLHTSSSGNAHQGCHANAAFSEFSPPVQNSFCCDHTCDTSQWAYVPVKIVSVRPPKFSRYESFPVRNGIVDFSNDIYSPSAYSGTDRYISRRLGNPKTFQRCQDDTPSGQVFLSSKGINYDGYYKEATIVDQRLAVSISMGYIAVKRPAPGSRGITQALLRAHDSCGRVCHPACKDPNTNQYMPCSGAVAISMDSPKMYGDTYDDAVLNVFDYDFNNDCPRFNTDNFFVTFYCDYHNEFPYAQTHHHEHPQTAPRLRPQQAPVVQAKRGSHPLSPSLLEGCRVSSSCVLDVPCVSEFTQCDQYNQLQLCRGSCNAFAQCSYGRYFLRTCPTDQYFDDVLKACVSGGCRTTSGGARTISPSGLTGRGSGSGRLTYLTDNAAQLGDSPANAGSGSYRQQMSNRLRSSDSSLNNVGGNYEQQNINKLLRSNDPLGLNDSPSVSGSSYQQQMNGRLAAVQSNDPLGLGGVNNSPNTVGGSYQDQINDRLRSSAPRRLNDSPNKAGGSYQQQMNERLEQSHSASASKSSRSPPLPSSLSSPSSSTGYTSRLSGFLRNVGQRVMSSIYP